MNEFENVEKWRRSGLLEGNEEHDALVLANNLEECANYLIELPESKDRELEAGLLLPIIVRLFNEQNVRMINMDEFHDKFCSFLEKHQPMTEDKEPEFCEKFVEQFF